MTHYKIHYLTDGTKVKITSQLFNQIKQWETDGVHIDSNFLDELKKQDNEWINSTRRYYRNTIAIESLSIQVLNQQKALRANSFQNISNDRLYINKILENLSVCTDTQIRRFLMYYYFGYSLTSISRHEKCSEGAVRKSIRKVKERINISKKLL